jgi:ankyrin repeat protein
VPWKNEDALREYERATLRLLLKATKHPEVRPRPVPSPLLMAFEKRRFDLAAELLGAGADARVIDGDGRTLLHYATPDLVAPLVEAGVDPNRRDRFGNTALHRAVLGFSRPPAELRAYVEAMVRSGAKDVRGERGQYAADIVSPVSRCKEEAADAWPAIQALLRSARE